MPPQRTIPPNKALKTERTHEENQERAYIAASRRSDRSLEARVESARRASEIHKRRTGRSLRVTEQDVVNEEMYEEEDDDLPMQYRRLTAHLQTGSADFNRRLSAYLTNHVAMRTALDQAITNSYAQQYPNAPQFVHNQNMFPSPFIAQNVPQQPSPPSYGQPYPTPGTPGYRPGHQARSASVNQAPTAYFPTSVPLPQSPAHSLPQLSAEHRRTSASSKSSSHSPHGAPATPTSLASRASLPQSSSTYTAKQENQPSQQMRAPPPQSTQPPQRPLMNSYSSTSPLSTALPMESQMLLGSGLDPNDPLTSIFMAGSECMPQPYNYNTTPVSLQKPRSFDQSYNGMSATLAPSALDMSPRHQIYNSLPTTTSLPPSSSPGFLNFDTISDFSKGHIYGCTSSTGSGTVTPGGIDGGWDAFINDNSWVENAT
ncbi:hypothetical protein P7C71_g1767, partial [Lecanoromycetidae sp. Uapishka_2]